MCRCTPEIRTPFCGKGDCVWPLPTKLSLDQISRAMVNLTDSINELGRLAKLSNQELVAECVNSDAADYEIVMAMMDRLDPDWAKRTSESEPDRNG